MGGQFIEALRIAASFATLNHSGVAILAASPRLKPAQRNQIQGKNILQTYSYNIIPVPPMIQLQQTEEGEGGWERTKN